jgi:hypothetical protein
LKYVVSCALDADQSFSVTVDDQTYTFQGLTGLAPEWGEAGGSCDETCQRWVSACVLARVDFYGVHRDISIRGAHPALRAVPHEMQNYRSSEATYYANLFRYPQDRFACLSPGQTEIPRVCGGSLDNCPMTLVGSSCSDACERPGTQGSFANCNTKDDQSGDVFSEAITVFLP